MSIIKRVNHLTQRIHQAEASYHRKSGSVCLVAVSKGRTHQEIALAYHAGIRHVGESYLQEAQPKLSALATLPICWHFIGPIQSNKTKGIARYFSWAHGVCRKKIAQQLHDERPLSMPPLQVCIQVNFDEDSAKSGVNPRQAFELAAEMASLSRLQLRGLMLIPKPQHDAQQQYVTCLQLTDLLHQLNSRLKLGLDTLSMGMSDDLDAAIRAGSTMVRVGRGLFGEVAS